MDLVNLTILMVAIYLTLFLARSKINALLKTEKSRLRLSKSIRKDWKTYSAKHGFAPKVQLRFTNIYSIPLMATIYIEGIIMVFSIGVIFDFVVSLGSSYRSEIMNTSFFVLTKIALIVIGVYVGHYRTTEASQAKSLFMIAIFPKEKTANLQEMERTISSRISSACAYNYNGTVKVLAITIAFIVGLLLTSGCITMYHFVTT